MRREPPGPTPHPLFGHLRSHLNNQRILAGLFELHAAYGPVVNLWVGPPRVGMQVLALSDPSHVKHVLQDNAKSYKKSRTYTRLKAVLGEGLLTSEGEFWRRQRRLAQPAFHKQKLIGFADTMAACTRVMLERWQRLADRGQAIDISREMSRLTFQIVGRTLFSADVEAEAQETGHALEVVLRFASEQLDSLLPTPEWVPTARNREYADAMRVLDGFVYGLIRARRQPGAARPNDLLTMLLEMRDADTGEQMTDRQLRDEVMTFVLAGHETTSTALGWTFYLLSRHPEAFLRLTEEVDRVVGDGLPGLETTMALPYTRRVFEEAMRLYPPAWILEREALVDDEIGGYHVAKGTTTILAPWVIHRNPDIWPNPEGFDPDRFLPAAVEARHKFAYFPFGLGARMCIGAGFAMMEAQIILAMVARRFRLDLVPGQSVEIAPHITLRQKGGIRMALHTRQHATAAIRNASTQTIPVVS